MSRLPLHAVAPDLPPPREPRQPLHQCPLCGFRFNEGKEVCGSCGLSGGCEAVGCPHCGYQFPLESSLLTWLRSLMRRLLGQGVRPV